MPAVLRSLTLLEHALLAVLTLVAAGRALAAGAPVAPILFGTVAFLAWYAVGAVRASRTDHGSHRGAALWFVVLSLVWLALVALSAEYVWVAFSLWLLAGHLLPLRWAVPYAAVAVAVVLVATARDSGSLTWGGALGPTIGAAFAIVASRGQLELVRDAVRRRELVRSLVASQAQAETLHAELASNRREAGVLAERARLSRDIHDTLAQGFSSIVLLARSADVTAGEEDLRGLLGRIESTAADNLGEARRVVAALAPRGLDSGLPATLRRLLDSLAEETGIAAELRLDGDFAGLPTAIEVALVRAAQGALANVRRHAEATRVVVSLAEAGDVVRLDVVDDGVGFDPERHESPRSVSAGGYGLPSTRARLRELGGGLEVESAPGEGTALSAFVPLGVAAS